MIYDIEYRYWICLLVLYLLHTHTHTHTNTHFSMTYHGHSDEVIRSILRLRFSTKNTYQRQHD